MTKCDEEKKTPIVCVCACVCTEVRAHLCAAVCIVCIVCICARARARAVAQEQRDLGVALRQAEVGVAGVWQPSSVWLKCCLGVCACARVGV